MVWVECGVMVELLLLCVDVRDCVLIGIEGDVLLDDDWLVRCLVVYEMRMNGVILVRKIVIIVMSSMIRFLKLLLFYCLIELMVRWKVNLSMKNSVGWMSSSLI